MSSPKTEKLRGLFVSYEMFPYQKQVQARLSKKTLITYNPNHYTLIVVFKICLIVNLKLLTALYNLRKKLVRVKPCLMIVNVRGCHDFIYLCLRQK